MAATLRPDSTTTKPVTTEGYREERLHCNDDTCGARWVMAYHPEEHAAEGRRPRHDARKSRGADRQHALRARF